MSTEILTAREVKERLRCSLAQVYRLFGKGEMAGFRVGASVRIYGASVQEYKDRRSNRKAPAAPPEPRPGRAGARARPAAAPGPAALRYFGHLLD